MNKGIPSFLIRKIAGEWDAEEEDRKEGHVYYRIDQIIEEPSPVGLPPSLERQRKRAIQNLGEKWLLHPCHAPRRGHYNNMGMLIEGDI